MIYQLEPGLTHWEELVRWWHTSPQAQEFQHWLTESVLPWLPGLLPATFLFLGLVLWVQSLMMLWKLWKEARKK